MHLGNGAITPGCMVYSMGLAGVGLSTAVLSARKAGITLPRLARAGGLGLAVLGVQMLNFPVGVFSSAHIVGGMLLAALLGPGLGALTMAAVLGAQAVCFHDGGLSALGANIINMALIPAAGAAWVRSRQGSRARWYGAMSALTVLGAAGLIVLEVGAFRSVSEWPALMAFGKAMLANHLLLALGEGALTFGLLRLAEKNEWHAAEQKWLPHAAGLAALGLVLAMVSFWASSALPDGYTAALKSSTFKVQSQPPAQAPTAPRPGLT